MLRLLLIVLGSLSLTASLARAEDAQSPCKSIVERDCAPVARVTAKGNLRVEVLEHKRTLHYPLSQVDEDRREEFASYCGKGPCECVEVVQYLDFKGPVPGFRQVNAVEHAAAQRVRCSVDNSDVHRQALQFAVSARFISTAFFELE